MAKNSEHPAPKWMKRTLQLAGLYSLGWGVTFLIAPILVFRWTGAEEPLYPQIWQCVGMIIGVYGVGYLLVANDPHRHWPYVLVGLLAKVCMPIVFLPAAMEGDLSWKWAATMITNDVIWWLPFAAILYGTFRAKTDTGRNTEAREFGDVTTDFRSNRNATLSELSSVAPTLLVFLRHAGCIFCRETLAELQRNRKAIERTGTTIAIVHMGNPMDGTLMLQKYELEGLHRFSDPKCELYRSFGLERGSVGQLFGPSVIKRGFEAAICGYGIGLLNGDGFRMPGVFVLAHGEIVEAHRSTTAADIVDFVKIVKRAPRLWRNTRNSSVNVSEEKRIFEKTNGPERNAFAATTSLLSSESAQKPRRGSGSRDRRVTHLG